MTILHLDLKPSEAAMAPFLTERQFYPNADEFWMQIEDAILSASESNNGITPFTYAFVPGIYQFLTVGGGEIFTPDLLQDFIDKLSSLAREKLNLQHVSTPQLRLYINSGSILKDALEISRATISRRDGITSFVLLLRLGGNSCKSVSRGRPYKTGRLRC